MVLGPPLAGDRGCGCGADPLQAETYHNLTGAQFYLFPAAALISLGRFEGLGWPGRTAVAVFFFVVVFSSPNAVMLLPILGLRCLPRLKRPDFLVGLTAYTFALVIANIIVSWTLYDTAGGRTPDYYFKLDLLFPYLIKTFGFKTAAVSLTGQQFAFQNLANFQSWLAFSLGFALLIGLHFWLNHRLQGASQKPGLLGGLIYFIIVPILFSYFARKWNTDYFINQNGLVHGTRYFVYTSYFYLIWLAALSQTLWRWSSLRLTKFSLPARGMAVGLGLVFILAAWNNFSYPTLPRSDWSKHIRSYYEQLVKVPWGGPDNYKYFIPIMPSPWRLTLPLRPLKQQERKEVEKMMEKLDRCTQSRPS